MPPHDPYRDFFERSADAHLIIDGETFVDCNQATVDLLRYRNKQELLQSHPSELSPELQPDGRHSFEKANEMIAIAVERGSHRFEWEHKRADGEVFPVEVVLTAVPGGLGSRVHTVWRDISDRKRLESELQQAQKLEALGRLAGGVAHDFNNLLVAILGHSELMEMELSDDSPLKEHAVEIRRAGERAADLVGQLLAFSRKQVLRMQVIDVVPLIVGSSRMLQRIIGEGIEIRTYVPDSPLFVKADPGQLEQVLLNLATNARDAMPGGGTLTAEATGVTLTQSTISPRLRLRPGDYTVISVTDTGAGIPPELLDKVFDPFFTTKTPGKGTGLGLATVYGVVKQSGGDIDVLSEPGYGTVFKVFLPRTHKTPTVATAEPKVSENLGGSETILLVEDDNSVGTLMARVLKGQGYNVLRASDGADALALIKRDKLQFDLLLTDVVMPHMGGLELARNVRETHPALPVLFASGYSENAVSQMQPEGGPLDLLQKPFSPRELSDRVRSILDRQPNTAP